jgi:KipI family sensor histidine kinase inhibitor
VRVLPCGDTALLVEVDSLVEVLGLAAALRADLPEGVAEIVPAARTVLLRCRPQLRELTAIADAVRRIGPRSRVPPSVGEVEIPVRYDGEDLSGAAEGAGLKKRELVELHLASSWTVAFCGFAPGFGYLIADTQWPEISRRANPRTRVPAGSVALAGQFSGVYPRESPGGWQLIGRTDVTVFDLARNPPALLRPGVRVRFVEVR